MELQALDGDILWRRIEKGAENLLTDPDKTVTCWCAEPSGSSFPLFSQKATWGSTLQVHAAKRFVVVSTDSQASSQQQGLFIWFRREPLASESCSCAYRAKRDRSQFLPSRRGKSFELSPQTNLAEVASLPQIVKGLSQLGETKDPIHHRTHSVKCNRLVHRFEHFPRAHVDRFYASTFAHERN